MSSLSDCSTSMAYCALLGTGIVRIILPLFRLDCENCRKGLSAAARRLSNMLLKNVVDTYRKENERSVGVAYANKLRLLEDSIPPLEFVPASKTLREWLSTPPRRQRQ